MTTTLPDDEFADDEPTYDDYDDFGCGDAWCSICGILGDNLDECYPDEEEDEE